MLFQKFTKKRFLSFMLAFLFLCTALIPEISRKQTAANETRQLSLPNDFIDLSNGLTAGKNYNGIQTLEDMPVNSKECTKQEFQFGQEQIILETFVQGSANPVTENNIPQSGAAFVITPFHSGTFTIAFKLYGGKKFFFVDDKGEIIQKLENTGTNAEYHCLSFDVQPGSTYYAYGDGTKIPTAGLSLVYDDFLNLSEGLLADHYYGEFSVLENMEAKSASAPAVTFTAKESGNSYTFEEKWVVGKNDAACDGNIPQSGAAFVIEPVKAGKLVIAIKLNTNKTLRIADSNNQLLINYKNTTGAPEYICHEIDVEAGMTYYAYGSGTKISVYGLGLIYDEEVDLSNGLTANKNYGGIRSLEDMSVITSGGSVQIQDEMTGKTYSYSALASGNHIPVLSNQIPASGAAIAINPVADGTFRMIFRLEPNKTFYFIDSSAPAAPIKMTKNTSAAAEEHCYTFDVTAGHAYYAYAADDKLQIGALALTYDSAIERNEEIILPDPISGVAQKACKTYDFDSTKEIAHMNASGNNSSIVNRSGVGNVLKLGAINNNVRANGVEISNPFAGKIKLRQTLEQAVEQNNVVYNGTIADEDENGYLVYNPNRTYPFPKYTNGVTVSTWVKVPNNVQANTTILAFTHEDDIARGVGAIRLNADGSIWFFEGTKAVDETSNGNYQRNCYLFNHRKANLTNRAGEWVHIAMTIENDKIGLFIDGLETEGKVDGKYSYGSSSSKFFNKGFGYRGALAKLSESYPEAAYQNYRDLLKNFSDGERADGNFKDFSKYTFLNSDGMLLVDFVTEENTHLFLGGDDGDAIWENAKFSASAEGMMYDDFMCFDYPLSAGEAYGLYLDFNGKNDTGSETLVEEGSKSDETIIIDHTPHSLVYTIDFDASVSGTAVGVSNLNNNINNSLLESVNGRGNVLKTGKLASDAATPSAVGVELVNPFAGHKQYDEDFIEALERNGVAFNGTTADLDEAGDLSYKDGLTWPFPKWSNGFTVTLWARMSRYATKDTPLLTFSRKNVTSGTGSLTIMAGGSARYYNSDNSLNDKRNAYYFNYSGEDLLKNAGKWVMVTITMENDNISIYYNGEQASGSAHPQMNLMRTSVKFFNYGFGYRGAMEKLSKTDPVEAHLNYRDLLDGFTAEEKAANDWSDFSKYTFLNCGRELLLEFLTDADTKLYIGGDFGTSMMTTGGSNQYSDDSAGLRVDQLNFYNYVLNDSEIITAYNTSKIENEADLEDEKPVETAPPINETQAPATSAPQTTQTAPPQATQTAAPQATQSAPPQTTQTTAPQTTQTTPPQTTQTAAPQTTQSAPPTSTNPPIIDYQLGDANKDGVINLDDAQLTLRIALSIEHEPDDISHIDTNSNGKVDLDDALYILKLALGITTNEKAVLTTGLEAFLNTTKFISNGG